MELRTLRAFVEVVRQVGRYWLVINLPPGRD